MTHELKPCPNCESKSLFAHDKYIQCGDCGMAGPTSIVGSASGKWNALPRSTPPAQPQLSEREWQRAQLAMLGTVTCYTQFAGEKPALFEFVPGGLKAADAIIAAVTAVAADRREGAEG